MNLLDLLNLIDPNTKVRICTGTPDCKSTTKYEGVLKNATYGDLKDILNSEHWVAAIANTSMGAVPTMNILITYKVRTNEDNIFEVIREGLNCV